MIWPSLAGPVAHSYHQVAGSHGLVYTNMASKALPFLAEVGDGHWGALEPFNALDPIPNYRPGTATITSKGVTFLPPTTCACNFIMWVLCGFLSTRPTKLNHSNSDFQCICTLRGFLTVKRAGIEVS